MKRTLACFAAALALFLMAIAFAARPQPQDRSIPLDMAGIERVRVLSPEPVKVTLASDRPAAMSYRVRDQGTADAVRDGDTLVITSTLTGYNALGITLPATLGLLEVERAAVSVTAPIERMELRVGRSLDWSGAVRRLVIVGADPPPACPDHACIREIAIEDGLIGYLDVTAPKGGVALQSPDTIGKAVIRLGPSARLHLSGARRLDNLSLQPLEGAR